MIFRLKQFIENKIKSFKGENKITSLEKRVEELERRLNTKDDLIKFCSYEEYKEQYQKHLRSKKYD